MDENPNCKFFLIDGFPRNIEQGDMFERDGREGYRNQQRPRYDNQQQNQQYQQQHYQSNQNYQSTNYQQQPQQQQQQVPYINQQRSQPADPLAFLASILPPDQMQAFLQNANANTNTNTNANTSLDSNANSRPRDPRDPRKYR